MVLFEYVTDAAKLAESWPAIVARFKGRVREISLVSIDPGIEPGDWMRWGVQVGPDTVQHKTRKGADGKAVTYLCGVRLDVTRFYESEKTGVRLSAMDAARAIGAAYVRPESRKGFRMYKKSNILSYEGRK